MDVELDFEKRYRLVREIIETVVLTVLMFLVIRLAVQNFNIEGMSMEPHLHNQELILVDKWSYLFHPLSRGDVIVFVAPPNPTQDYIKRIIGLPGDIITIRGSTVYVNGERLSEPYVDPQLQGNPYASFSNRVVPANAYFVLGDNRAGSSDSRDWGCVPRGNIIGRAALVYWPLRQDNDGLLPNFSSAFRNVPAPNRAVASTPCPLLNGPVVPPAVSGAQQDGLFSSAAGPRSMDVVLVLVLPGLFAGLSSTHSKQRPRRARRPSSSGEHRE